MTGYPQRPLPQWFADAKLGIFVHWGIFAVPAFAPRGTSITELMHTHYDEAFALAPYTEWYENALRFPKSPTSAHHKAHYGRRSYQSFRAEFDRASEKFEAGDWANLFAAAGARYMVFVTKHHDGYALWPTSVENPHRPGWHSKRDFVGELAEAIRARGMTFGTYYSGGLDWTFRQTPIGNLGDMFAAVPTDDAYRAYCAAQMRELVARYKPAVLWNDIAYPSADDLPALLKDYYAAVPDGVINDRWFASRELFEGLRDDAARAGFNRSISDAIEAAGGELPPPPTPVVFDFRTAEYTTTYNFGGQPFEATRGMGLSFGYNRAELPEDRLSADDLIGSFVDIVAGGGNLLLNVGPMADGTVPPEQRELLGALGAFMKKNGEAIYDTRAWTKPTGRATDGTPYAVTRKGSTLYVILTADARSGMLALPGIAHPTRARRLDGGTVNLTDDRTTSIRFEGARPKMFDVIALEGSAVP